MDSLITAAARALAAGDALGALNHVALRDDAPALALRGIAMAQLGDLARAKVLLRNAVRAFAPKAVVARARCVVAEAEIALASRELGRSVASLQAARSTLEERGDRANAIHASYLEVRYLILTGRIDDAGKILAGFDPASLPPTLRVIHELAYAGIAMRRLQAGKARSALTRARDAAQSAGIPALLGEVEGVQRTLELPAARLLAEAGERQLRLDDIEALLASSKLIVDACRLAVRCDGHVLSLATRPVLFTLVYVLAEAWPEDVSREELVARAFRLKDVDESLRGRLRVEIGRLRAVLKHLADVKSTKRGFILAPSAGNKVVILAHPVEERYATILALLADGEAWASSAIAMALGMSQRSVQRALESLLAADKVQFFGRGRSRRWLSSAIPGFATTLLLPHWTGGD